RIPKSYLSWLVLSEPDQTKVGSTGLAGSAPLRKETVCQFVLGVMTFPPTGALPKPPPAVLVAPRNLSGPVAVPPSDPIGPVNAVALAPCLILSDTRIRGLLPPPTRGP